MANGVRETNGSSVKGHMRVVSSRSTNVRPLDPDRLPWEVQEEETAHAYSAFMRYRDLPPERRSVRQAHEEACRAVGDEAAGSKGVWEDWCSRWSWVDRALEWDLEQDRVRRRASLEEQVAMGKRHAQAAQLYLQTLLQPAAAILKKIREDPAWMDNLVGSNPITMLSQLERLTRAMETVVKVERLARGQPVSITEVNATVQETTGSRDAARAILADEETAEVAEALLEKLYQYVPKAG